MHISKIGGAQALAEKYRELKRSLDLISSGKGLGITIQSTYQDDDFVNAVRGAVEAELANRTQLCRIELEALGVTDYTSAH